MPLVILAGKEYGSGSSRDWAAKGTRLLGVRAVIAESYERIHRSNLIGMGVLPLQFPAGENAESLGLDGTETFAISGSPRSTTEVRPGRSRSLPPRARRRGVRRGRFGSTLRARPTTTAPAAPPVRAEVAGHELTPACAGSVDWKEVYRRSPYTGFYYNIIKKKKKIRLRRSLVDRLAERRVEGDTAADRSPHVGRRTVLGTGAASGRGADPRFRAAHTPRKRRGRATSRSGRGAGAGPGPRTEPWCPAERW